MQFEWYRGYDSRLKVFFETAFCFSGENQFYFISQMNLLAKFINDYEIKIDLRSRSMSKTKSCECFSPRI